MSATAIRRFDLSWLKPPAMPEDGNMALVDHLRELRYRVIVSVVAILVVMVVAWFFYTPLLDLVMWPYYQAVAQLKLSRPDLTTQLSMQGVAAPFMMQVKTCGFASLIASCPIWLYQLWAFIAPGLLAHEKKMALKFLGASVPLFLAGVAVGYLITPKGYQVMIGFVPKDQQILSLLDADTFLVNEMKLLALFGASFLLPVIIVTLNLVGLVKGVQLGQFRRVAIFLCFVFGAVATPSTDPFSMCAMAVPMAVMYVVAEWICKRHDKKVASLAHAGDGDVVLKY